MNVAMNQGVIHQQFVVALIGVRWIVAMFSTYNG